MNLSHSVHGQSHNDFIVSLVVIFHIYYSIFYLKCRFNLSLHYHAGTSFIALPDYSLLIYTLVTYSSVCMLLVFNSIIHLFSHPVIQASFHHNASHGRIIFRSRVYIPILLNLFNSYFACKYCFISLV